LGISAPARAPVNPKDTALESFDAVALELHRLTKGQKPQRFSKTAVPQPLLGDLAHFFRELVAVRKLTTETIDDPTASAEKRKAEYAAAVGS
jgi:hypothetical protein